MREGKKSMRKLEEETDEVWMIPYIHNAYSLIHPPVYYITDYSPMVMLVVVVVQKMPHDVIFMKKTKRNINKSHHYHAL